MYNRRRRAHPSSDRRIFTATADRVHKKNLRVNPMRGGYRL